jgi:hypothetical protein
MSGLPPELRERVLQSARSQPSPTRGVLQRQRVFAAGVAFAWMIGLAFALHAHMPHDGAMLLLGTWLVSATIATFIAFGPSRSSLGPSRGLFRSLGLLLGALVMVSTGLIALGWQGAAAPTGHHVECWIASSAVSIGPVAAILWVERNRDPIAPAATGAGLGAVAGAWAAVAMGFVCHRTEPMHVLAAHVGVFLLVVMIGAIVGRGRLALK